MKKARVKNGIVDARIDFPSLKLKLKSNDPVSSLKEINKILYSLRSFDYSDDFNEDDDLFFRLGYISEEIKNDQICMDFIRKALLVEESCRVKRLYLENVRVVDFNSSECLSQIDIGKARQRVNSLCRGMDRTNYVLLHLQGSISGQDCQSLVDLFKNRLPHVEIRTLFSQKDMLGKSVIEAIFFGPFEEELW